MVLINLTSLALTPRPDEEALFAQMARFMSRPLAHEGLNAATTLELQGPEQLTDYLEGLGRFWQRSLLDERGRDLSGGVASEELTSVALHLLDSGKEELLERPFYVQRITSNSGRHYVFAAQLERTESRRLSAFRLWYELLPFFRFPNSYKVITILIVSAIVCLGLARYLTAPIGRIREAAQEVANGNLNVRVGEQMGNRRDEPAQLAHDFDAMAARMQSLLEAQSRLLRDVSHELRTPLTRLLVALELARQNIDPAAAASLDRIELEANRLDQLIGQVLMLTRLEAAVELTQREDIALGGLLEEIVEDAEFEAESRNRSVRLQKHEPCTISGSRQLLRSAIENIVRNAIRFTPLSTAVDVDLRCGVTDAGNRAEIEVRDHGPGVAPERLEAIFQPFSQSARSQEATQNSHGLGLSIARRAVELHGGTIRATNLEGGGLSMLISLPVRRNSPQPVDPASMA